MDIAYLIARRILPLLAAGLGVGMVLVVIAQRTLTHFFAAMSGGSISSIVGAAVVLLLAAMVAALSRIPRRANPTFGRATQRVASLFLGVADRKPHPARKVSGSDG